MSDRRIGVFICHCGGNISDYVDVEKVRDVVSYEEDVVLSNTTMFTCSDAAQQEMINAIEEHKLDGIVVASCSPKLHQETFRAMAQRGGLNKYVYSQVNIREQCSWAHTNQKEGATEKAIRLVRAGIARTRSSRPLENIRIETISNVLVIGAGVSGMRAAVGLADLGMNVHLIEQSDKCGGHVSRLGKLFPRDRRGDELVNELETRVKSNKKISLHLQTRVLEKKGSVGNFHIRLSSPSGEQEINVGAIIVATGFESYTPQEGEYGFGSTFVVTLPKFRELLESSSGRIEYAGKRVKSIAYLYCVGSRESAASKEGAHVYCSRYCCSAAVHTAILVSEIDKDIHQFHLFRDIRTYGAHELLYDKALSNGSIFLKFQDEAPPKIEPIENGVRVKLKDMLTGGEDIEMDVDLLVLVTGMEARKNDELVDILKVPVGKDGFFNEIHPKLRPVETVVDGLFIAGTAQGPKTLPESVASAMSAVAKNAALLVRGYLDLEPFVAVVDKEKCTWCGACAEACPYEAISKMEMEGKSVAKVNTAQCKGCGGCVPVCDAMAIGVEGYNHDRIEKMIGALIKEAV